MAEPVDSQSRALNFVPTQVARYFWQNHIRYFKASPNLVINEAVKCGALTNFPNLDFCLQAGHSQQRSESVVHIALVSDEGMTPSLNDASGVMV